jgi:hypothetical protein
LHARSQWLQPLQTPQSLRPQPLYNPRLPTTTTTPISPTSTSTSALSALNHTLDAYFLALYKRAAEEKYPNDEPAIALNKYMLHLSHNPHVDANGAFLVDEEGGRFSWAEDLFSFLPFPSHFQNLKSFSSSQIPNSQNR